MKSVAAIANRRGRKSVFDLGFYDTPEEQERKRKQAANQNRIKKMLKFRLMKDMNQNEFKTQIGGYLSKRIQENQEVQEQEEEKKRQGILKLTNMKRNSACFTVENKFYFFSNYSLGIFSQSNLLRNLLASVVLKKSYNRLYLFMTALQAIFLGLQAGIEDFKEELERSIFALTCFFLFDCVAKIIVKGFNHELNSYSSNPFQMLDLFLCLIGLQIIRPFCLVQSHPQTRLYAITIFKSLPKLKSVTFFLFFIFLLFAILGMELFSGKYYGRCRQTERPVNATYWPIVPETQWCGEGFYNCPSESFCGKGSQFDISLKEDGLLEDASINYNLTSFENILKALFTVFQVVTLDSWTTHMYGLMRAAELYISSIYFTFLIVLGNFFLLNLVLAVIIDSFNQLHQPQIKNPEQIMMLLKLVIARKFQIGENQPSLKRQLGLKEKKEEKAEEDSGSEIEQSHSSRRKSNYIQGTFGDYQNSLREGRRDSEFAQSSYRSDAPLVQQRKVKSILKKPQNSFGLAAYNQDDFKSRRGSLTKNLQEMDHYFQRPPKMPQSFTAQHHQFSKNSNYNQDLSESKQELKQEYFQFEENKKIQVSATSSYSGLAKYTSQIEEMKEEVKEEIKEEIKEQHAMNNFSDTDDEKSNSVEQGFQNSRAQKQRTSTFAKKISDMKFETKINFLPQLEIGPRKSEQIISPTFKAVMKFRPKRRTALSEQQLSEQILSRQDSFQALLDNVEDSKKIISKLEGIKERQMMKQSSKRSKKSKILRILYTFSFSKPFVNFIQIAIISNTLLLCMDRYPISAQETQVQETLNMIFTFVFLFEFLIKVVGQGLSFYFFDIFNRFDSLIVLLSMIDLALNIANITATSILIPVRAFRLLRVFKLAQSWTQFRLLLSTIVRTLKDIGPFIVLLNIFVFIYACLGIKLFKNQVRINSQGLPNSQQGSYADSNFNNFWDAFLTVFIVLLNDGWSTIFFQHAKASNLLSSSYIYFLSLIIFGQFVMLNLFMAILLEHFDSDSKSNEQTSREEELEKQKQQKILQKQLKERIENNLNETERQKIALDRFKSNFSKKSTRTRLSTDLNQKYIFGKAFFLFDSQSPIRVTCHNLVTHKFFDLFVILIILASIVSLALENPLDNPKSNKANILRALDYFFTSFFILEMLLKSMAFGFLFNGYFSYLKNSWNILDFIIVLFSMIQYFFGNGLGVLRLFRIVRTLRPLRMVTRNQGLKIAVESLIKSIKDIFNALLISFMILLIFSIMFVNLLKGQLFQCNQPLIEQSYFKSQFECLDSGGVWEKFMFTYDNVPLALQTLFHKAITVGWAELMYFGVRTTEIGSSVHLTKKNHYLNSFLSIIFMLLFSIFILNIFIGIVISTYNREEEKLSKRALLTNFQSKWVRILTNLTRYGPQKRIKTDSKVREALIRFFSSKRTKKIFSFIIILSSIPFFLHWEGLNEEISFYLDYSQRIFEIIFIIEASLKIFALRSLYFQSNWIKLDFFAALMCLLSILGDYLMPNSIWIRLVKGLRILRLFRLTKKFKSIELILDATLSSAEDLLNVGALMLLFLFIYSILGVNLFATVKIQEPLDSSIVNFMSFERAFLILFRAATGENWHYVMYGISRERQVNYQCVQNFDYKEYEQNGEPNSCGNHIFASLYFISFTLFVNLVLLNLFIAIVLQSYQMHQDDKSSIVNIEVLKKFVKVWKKFDPWGRGFIKKEQLKSLLIELNAPLGIEKDSIEENEVLSFSFLNSLELSLYNDLYDYQFYNVIERLARKALIDDQLAKILDEKENSETAGDQDLEDVNQQFKNMCQEIAQLEENEFQINVVQKANTVKEKYQGVGMFEIVTWKEQISLIKFCQKCKAKIEARKKVQLICLNFSIKQQIQQEQSRSEIVNQLRSINIQQQDQSSSSSSKQSSLIANPEQQEQSESNQLPERISLVQQQSIQLSQRDQQHTQESQSSQHSEDESSQTEEKSQIGIIKGPEPEPENLSFQKSSAIVINNDSFVQAQIEENSQQDRIQHEVIQYQDYDESSESLQQNQEGELKFDSSDEDSLSEKENQMRNILLSNKSQIKPRKSHRNTQFDKIDERVEEDVESDQSSIVSKEIKRREEEEEKELQEELMKIELLDQAQINLDPSFSHHKYKLNIKDTTGGVQNEEQRINMKIGKIMSFQSNQGLTPKKRRSLIDELTQQFSNPFIFQNRESYSYQNMPSGVFHVPSSQKSDLKQNSSASAARSEIFEELKVRSVSLKPERENQSSPKASKKMLEVSLSPQKSSQLSLKSLQVAKIEQNQAKKDYSDESSFQEFQTGDGKHFRYHISQLNTSKPQNPTIFSKQRPRRTFNNLKIKGSNKKLQSREDCQADCESDRTELKAVSSRLQKVESKDVDGSKSEF